MGRIRTGWILWAPLLAACGGLTACGGDPAPGPAPDEPEHPLAACAEVQTSPRDVLEVLDALEAIDEPTIPCLVASLERPLSVVVSKSQFSAQPAVDDDNPRIFLMLPGLVMTVVTAGFGQDLLELGEWTSPTRTLKGELAFPLTTPLADEAPFEQVLNTSPTVSGIATGCAVCHGNEELALELDGVNGYSSVAYRPLDELVVPLSTIEVARRGCSALDRSPRCDLLRALVDFGAEEGAFDPAVAGFTD